MKTLDFRTSETIESTSIRLEDGCNGVEQKIYFRISESYNNYTDGTKELFQRTYIKNDHREYVNMSEKSRYYSNEKGYRNAIKRWSKKSI